MSEYPKELVEAVARSLYSASGMPKPRWEEIRRSLLDVYFRDARAALEAADKWRAEHAAAEAPAPIGERVTDIGTLRVGDRVSFLAGDRDERFFGWWVGGGAVKCEGLNPDGERCPWHVSALDLPNDAAGWRDLRLVSSAPVETAPDTKASAAATEPAAKPEQLAREVLEGLAVELDRRAAYEHSTADKWAASGDPMFAEHRRGAAYAYLAAARDARSMELETANATPPSAADAQAPGLLEAYDAKLTSIRVALTKAGVPEHEPYPPEDVDDRERSLRTGGRMIKGAVRVEMLAADRDAWKTRAEMAEAKVPRLLEEIERLTREVNERCREIGILHEDDTAVRDRAQTIVDECIGPYETMPMDALLTVIECALRERGEWNARAVDTRVQLTEARAAIGEAWFHGNATIADAIRRKCMALESTIGKARAEKAPALPYEEDAELVEACCRDFWGSFVHFKLLTKAESRSEMRGLLRTVREHHQSRAKAQAVAEPEPKVEQVTREEFDKLRKAVSALTSAMFWLGQRDRAQIAEDLLREVDEMRSRSSEAKSGGEGT